jgi:hypothetical protein
MSPKWSLTPIPQKSSLTMFTLVFLFTCFLFAPVWSVILARMVNQKAGRDVILVPHFSRVLLILCTLFSVLFAALAWTARDGPSLELSEWWLFRTFFAITFAIAVMLVSVVIVLNIKVFLVLERLELGKTRVSRSALFILANIFLLFFVYPYLHFRIERISRLTSNEVLGSG